MSENHLGLTGRISKGPHDLLRDEVLEPQLIYELEHLLPYYIRIEKSLLQEYQLQGLVEQDHAERICNALDELDAEKVEEISRESMSDMAFSIEKWVERHGAHPNWHVDRSRNDFQACAQIMFARDQLLYLMEEMLDLIDKVIQKADETKRLVMPGYTHYQAAQIISPGFYLSALAEELSTVYQNLKIRFDYINQCPLGAGAMAGSEIRWDRERVARSLGFRCARRHALVSVASRNYTLQMGAELSNFGLILSRFISDFILWGSSEFQLIDLPDELSGISSAMPQKKNFPILERIRGKTAHLSAFYMDFVIAQRNTAYTNLVEVSKEAGTYFVYLLNQALSVIRLTKLFIENIQFRNERMQAICQENFFGGFSLANWLTLHYGIPYRQSQVIAGKFIVACLEKNHSPQEVVGATLEKVAKNVGIDVKINDDELKRLFDPQYGLDGKNSIGSTRSEEVERLLALQREEWQADKRSLYQELEKIKSVYQKLGAKKG